MASVGGPPEHRGWMDGDPLLAPQIASSALVHAFCTVDAGMTYMRTTAIGERSFLQARVHVGHNAVIGDDCEICAGVVICGEVTIGDGVRVSGNSWVKPQVTIGDGAIIGGGSVVTKDVPAHEVWCGNPARFLKLADTHPGRVGPVGYGSSELEQRQRAARRFPSEQEIVEHLYVAALDGGHGAGVAGDFA